MGKILPLLHLAFFGHYDKARYSNALIDARESLGAEVALTPPQDRQEFYWSQAG